MEHALYLRRRSLPSKHKALVLLAILCFLVSGMRPALAASQPEFTQPTITGEQLTAPGTVPPERALVLFDYAFAEGDTLGGLAIQFHVSAKSILSVNDCSEVAVGQVLRIPSFDVIAHPVRTGDELEQIAARYNVSLGAICQTNGLSAQAVLLRDTTVYIPVAGVYYPGGLNLLRGEFYYKSQSDEHWFCLMDWPVQGTLSSPFGQRSSGFHHAIDIAAPYGKIIIAPRAGRVMCNMTYDRDGYLGNHYYIDHGNGLVTLYGHLSEGLVLAGQWVKTGQPIGRIGSNGNATGDHVHFGVFIDGEAVDPLLALGG